jgi:hypothetical protein
MGHPGAMFSNTISRSEFFNSHDYIHLFHGDSRSGEGRRQKLLIAVDLPELFRLLVADSGLDQYCLPAGPHHDRVQPQQDAVLIVGGSAPLPQRLWNDAEHSSAVEPVGSIRADRYLEVSDLGANSHKFPGVRRLRLLRRFVPQSHIGSIHRSSSLTILRESEDRLLWRPYGHGDERRA